MLEEKRTRNLAVVELLQRFVATAAVMAFIPGLAYAADIDVRVSASTDDAEERADGSVGRTSSDLELVFDRGGVQTVGMRFNGITIPRGATVTNAYIQFTADERTSEATELVIQGEASNNATTFTNAAFGISIRPRTLGSVAWTPDPWLTAGQSGPAQRTPDITALVQEIVNRGGWESGNSLVIVITGSGERVAESFNGAQSAAPLLHVEFDDGGGPANQPPVTYAGVDTTITLPANTVALDGTVSDDGLPDGNLTTTWSHVGGTGAGLATFADVNAVDTSVTFSPDPGSYVLRLEASDGQFSTSDQITVTVVSEGAASLDRRVSASTDDAEERANGSVGRTSSDLELVFDRNVNQTVGMRFNGIDIPRGASVTNAYIQFTADESTSGTTVLTIEGQASDDAGTFSNNAFDISSRPRTSTSVAWSPAPWSIVGQAGAAQRTPNLAALVQQIVSRNGWVSGNSIVMLVTGTGERVAESFNGVPSAAPLLHIDYEGGGGGPVNQAPITDAGFDVVITLPSDTVLLDGTVSDDGLPNGTVTTLWSHIGGTGGGFASFADASAVDTSVTFSPDPGTYVLQLDADDGQLSATDEVTVTVRAGGGIEVTGLIQVNYFQTGFDDGGNQLTIPSIDPAGVLYHEPTGRLFIADSEINEVAPAWNAIQANIFQTAPNGDTLHAQWDLTAFTGNEPVRNREPTGITYCATDGHFYVSNDDADRIFRYSFDGSALTAVDSVSTRPASNDPEGITCDPATGTLYVIEGTEIEILVYRYNAGFELQEVLDLSVTAGSAAGVPSDAEGIAFDPVSGNLFVMSDPEKTIYEYTAAGVFVQKFDIRDFTPRPVAPQGLSIGTSSTNSQTMSLYIADGGVDNDQDPDERDGAIYEAQIQRD